MIPFQNITINLNETLGYRMNFTYNEDPYWVWDYWQDSYGNFHPVNIINEQQENWALDIADFLPYSLLSYVSFENFRTGDALIKLKDSQI